MPLIVQIANLEEGYPTVNVGLLRMEKALNQARLRGATLLKLIHGYGSTGTGGRLRGEVRRALERHRKAGLIAAFVAGEDFRISDETTWALLKKYPELKQDRDLSRNNKGITVVVL